MGDPRMSAQQFMNIVVLLYISHDADIRGDADRRVLSAGRLRCSALAAKPAEEHAAGEGGGPAVLANRARGSVLVGGSVQLADPLLDDHVADM